MTPMSQTITVCMFNTTQENSGLYSLTFPRWVVFVAAAGQNEFQARMKHNEVNKKIENEKNVGEMVKKAPEHMLFANCFSSCRSDVEWLSLLPWNMSPTVPAPHLVSVFGVYIVLMTGSHTWKPRKYLRQLCLQ